MLKLKRNERLLIFGRWTSSLGNIIFDYVNSVKIVSIYSESALVLAIYQSAEILIGIIFNLIGGVLADGSNKKHIIIFTDLLSAFVCFMLSFFINSKFMAAIIISANVLLAIINAFNSPTYKSIVREMIYKDRIGFYNSISNGGSEIIKIVGPMIGMLLVDLLGVQGSILINAGTFFISAVLEIMLVSLEPKSVSKRIKLKIFKDIVEGFKYLCKEKLILYLLILSAMVNFFLAGYNLLIPYTDIMYKGIYTSIYSKILIVEALGGILGSFISSKFTKNREENPKILVMLLGITGAFLILIAPMSYSSNIIYILTPYLGYSTVLTIFNIQFISYIQVKVDEDYLGRVFSIIFTVAVLFMPVGSFFFSFICSTSQIESFLIIGGGITILALISRMLIVKLSSVLE